MIDGMYLFQLAGVIIPTIAVFALFVRLGKLLDTVERLEKDVAQLTVAVNALTKVATALEAWREASKTHQEDMMARVRRLEDRELKGVR